MSYRAHVAKTWDRAILSSVLLELTYRCDLDCFLCYNDRRQRGVPMTQADYFQLLEDLAGMQVLTVVLSGGEPLAHPDFWAIGNRARELGFVVRLKSNGNLIDRTTALRLKREVAPFVVEISLHGATPETHDRQTRVPGSFMRLLENLKQLGETGLRTKLHCPLTSWNEGEVAALHALAESLRLPLTVDPRLTPRDDGDSSPLEIAASTDATRKLLELSRSKTIGSASSRPAADTEGRAESCRHCGAGASTLAVDPWGEVFPCVQWRCSIGNLRSRRIQDLWEGSDDLREVRRVTAEVKRRFELLAERARPPGFCPAVAERQTGSAFEIDPGTLSRMDASSSGLRPPD